MSWFQSLAGFRIPRPRSGFHKQICSGFWILQANVSWIPDSESRNIFWIRNSTSKYVLDSGFHKQICSGFRTPQANMFWIRNSTSKYVLDLDSTSKCILDSGFHKQMFFWVPDSTSKCFLDSEIHFILHGTKATNQKSQVRILCRAVKPLKRYLEVNIWTRCEAVMNDQ